MSQAGANLNLKSHSVLGKPQFVYRYALAILVAKTLAPTPHCQADVAATGEQLPNAHQSSEESPSVVKALRQSPRRFKMLAVVGAGLSLSVAAYGFTRPCVLGDCSVVAQAKRLEQIEPSKLNPSQTLQETRQTIKSLDAIPAWSAYGAEAKLLRSELASLHTIVAAQVGVAEAMKPLSAATKIQRWQQAIASLKTISAQSKLHSLAQTHIQEYEHNIATEKQAQKSFTAAQTAAELAQIRTSAARSVPDWQLVEATWEAAIQRLQEIAAETTLYAESQKQLVSYSSKLQTAEKRRHQEELASDTHNRAASSAKLALDAESAHQWSAAIAHWRNALSTVNQVPQNTAQHQHSRSLADKYAQALNQAQGQQRNQSDLQQVCAQEICRYVVEKRQIKVYLTDTYVKKVRQIALDAKVLNNIQAQVNLLDHIASLEKELEAISYNAALPVEVYSPQKALLLVFKSDN